MNKMYIMCGIIGSFKTTNAKRIQKQNSNSVIVSRDNLREMMFHQYVFSDETEEIVRRFNTACISTAIMNYKDVIIDETNITKKKRAAFINIAHNAGYKPVIIWCMGDGDNLMHRMKEPRGYTEERWAAAIKEMEEKFEKPTLDECVVFFVTDNFADFTQT